MSAAARASTGVRLEDAAVLAAREASAARADAARGALTELGLLVEIATELRDLTGADVTVVQGAIDHARRALAAAR
jgi:hypothetical protein